MQQKHSRILGVVGIMLLMGGVSAQTARYDVASGHGLGDAKFSVTLGAGVYYRWKKLEIGLSYQSRPLGSDVPGVEVAAPSTSIVLPPRDANAAAGASAQAPRRRRAAARQAGGTFLERSAATGKAVVQCCQGGAHRHT